MINIILSGANGKMGRVIARLASQMDDVSICAGFDIDETPGDGFLVYSDPDKFDGDADVIIDFSHPDALPRLIDFSIRRKTPIVIATTGLSKSHLDLIKKTSAHIPVFFSANMSLGVNLLIDLVCRAASVLSSGFDIEIIEKHHNQKIDAPSGTALAIADALCADTKNQFEYVYDRHSVRRRRGENEIGIHAVRGGTIVGEHSVIFAGNDEIIEIKHSAASKEIFAVGALRAAKFLVGKSPALYSMSDLLK